jgi:hypothetical protein
VIDWVLDFLILLMPLRFWLVLLASVAFIAGSVWLFFVTRSAAGL